MCDTSYQARLNNVTTNDLLSHMKGCLETVVTSLAAKFGLVDDSGSPRRAFIIDSLFRFSCLGCIWKTFTQMRVVKADVDTLYLEMHSLAVNLLSGALMQALGCKSWLVECEDVGEYGKVDVSIKPEGFGIIVEAENALVIVEIKTGRGISFAQLFRYLLQHPSAVLVVWRVSMRQVFTLRGERLQALLCIYLATVISRALCLLNNDFVACKHSSHNRRLANIDSPQRILDEYFDGLAQSLTRAVEAVIEGLKEAGANVE